MAQNTGELRPPARQPVEERPTEPNAAETDPPRQDVVFGVIQNARRRHILRYLDDEGSTTIGSLATHIAALENGIEERAVSSDQRKLVYVALYQSHLPKLDDAGCVSYDSNRGTVAPTEEINEFLSLLARYEDAQPTEPWRRGIYSLSAAGLLGLMASFLLLPVTMWLPPILFIGLALVTALGALVLIGLALRH
jgi:hypothetical protein